MEKEQQHKNFEIENGLGKITFSARLITDIIKSVLSSYPRYEYLSHSIIAIQDNYYEVSVKLKIIGDLITKEIDSLHKDLLLVIKQSLSITSLVAINLDYGK
ncbi:MAG: hypothetical protein MJ223_01980 [Mycoplasmoidaceae bacterium]|nr:hypothetical protein [Mycoplasmoidaceae bacterium]